MRTFVTPLVLGCTLAGGAPALAHHPLHGNGRAPTTVAVFGDAPYGISPGDDSQTKAMPAFIDSINADKDVSLVLHVGDIHSGKQYCTEAYDRTIFDLYRGFDAPLVYTPGDNEWADCHKVAEGGGAWNATTQSIDYIVDAAGKPVDYAKGNPAENLALVRKIFFPFAGVTLGRHPMVVLSQADVPGPETDRHFVENVMWVQSRVLIVTVNLPGGSNNDADIWYGAPTMSAAQTSEIARRTGADLRWIDLAFAVAGFSDIDGIIIQTQADMWDPEKGAAHQAGYQPFVDNIATHTLAFGKPVLMLNGDSHVYRSDNPLAAADPLNYMHPGYDVANFHRIVVHGSTTPLEWLKLTIDPRQHSATGPDTFGPFSWQRVVPTLP